MNDRRKKWSILAKAALVVSIALALSITTCFAAFSQVGRRSQDMLLGFGAVGTVVSFLALVLMGIIGLIRLMFRRRP